jgi:hypothetical protein
MIRHHQPLEALMQRRAVELLVGDALTPDLRLIRGERHRGRTEIEVLVHCFLGGAAARLAQRIAHRQPKAARNRADRLNEF